MFDASSVNHFLSSFFSSRTMMSSSLFSCLVIFCTYHTLTFDCLRGGNGRWRWFLINLVAFLYTRRHLLLVGAHWCAVTYIIRKHPPVASRKRAPCIKLTSHYNIQYSMSHHRLTVLRSNPTKVEKYSSFFCSPARESREHFLRRPYSFVIFYSLFSRKIRASLLALSIYITKQNRLSVWMFIFL